MKKIIALCLLFAGITALGFMLGCGQSTQTTTTTTTTTTATISATEVTAAKTGVLLASGGSSVGVSAASVGTAAGAKPMSLSVKAAATDGPPDAFFTVDLLTGTASLDGYLSATTDSVGGNMTPYMRMKTRSGVVINGAFLADKKIARFITVEVRSIFTGGEGTIPEGMTAEVSYYATRYGTAYGGPGGSQPFSNTDIFRAISSEADYLAWAFVFPTMEAGVNQIKPAWLDHIHLTTPEVSSNDKIGSMDMKMVFSKSATGEIVLSVATEMGGKPNAGTHSGNGTLATPAGSMETTLTMDFSTSGPPSSVTLVGTTESTPVYTVKIYMSPATMTATGEVLDSTGTRIGTIEGSSAGGKVYVGGSSEAFTF